MSDVWAVTQALYVTKKASKINVTLGNVSGDMDSVIGSIILGYYLTHKNNFYSDEEEKTVDPDTLSEERLSKLYVPVINMNSSELEARGDIIYHLNECGVNRSHIVSYDMIDIEGFEDKEVHLVDHNFPDCNQEHLVPYVTSIYDHHHDKNAEYPRLQFKDVRFCGAAVTLVVNAVLNDEEWASKLVDDKVAKFFSSAMLIDTFNFCETHRGKKWDQIDEDTFKRVKDIAGETLADDYFDKLYSEKLDEEKNIKLGYHLLARKDYKNYRMKDGTVLGISTVFLDIRVCEKEFTATALESEFKDIMEEKKLDGYVVLTHYDDGSVKRQIASYATNKNMGDELVKLWEGISDIEVERIDVGGLKDIENCAVWQNHSVSHSRKKLEPFFRKFFDDKA